MIPKSFSATALQVAEACTARYKAEMLDRARGFGSSTAATLGSAVHGALENYVKITQLDKTQPESEDLLYDLFKISYMTTFGTADLMTEDYFDGMEMLKKWFARTNFSEFEVISCEVKSNFPIKTTAGKIPFNYIWDRFDYLGDGEWRVVDYKTNRWGLRPEDLRKKIQARAYSVAAAIEGKAKGREVKRIWVCFDMLRHDGMVGVSFNRDDNIAAYNFLKAAAQRVIDTPDDEVEETLNNECLFCVRKQSCKALLKNVSVGGLHSVTSIEEAIDLRAQLDLQAKAINAAVKELDDKIITEAKERDEVEFESDLFVLAIGMSSQRAVDAEMVERAIGPQLFEKYGGKSFTMGSVDKLLKGNELDASQKSALRGLIYNKRGEPRVKVQAKNPIDED